MCRWLEVLDKNILYCLRFEKDYYCFYIAGILLYRFSQTCKSLNEIYMFYRLFIIPFKIFRSLYRAEIVEYDYDDEYSEHRS